MKLAAAVLTGNSVLNSVLTAVNRQIENWLLLLKWVITVRVQLYYGTPVVQLYYGDPAVQLYNSLR